MIAASVVDHVTGFVTTPDTENASVCVRITSPVFGETAMTGVAIVSVPLWSSPADRPVERQVDIVAPWTWHRAAPG